MKLKNIIYLLIVILIGGFIVYRIFENKEESQSGGPGSGKGEKGGKSGKGGGAPVRVNGIVVTPKTFANVLSVSGSLEANEQVEIRGEVSGLVENIYFDEGKTVKKGQVLLKVNDVELRAQLVQAMTKQELAAENERRAKLLLKAEAISQEEYDVTNADLKSARALSQLIQAQIHKATVRAPFDGKIGLRNISPGTYITPTTVIAKLINIDPIKLSFSIPEKYVRQVKLNTKVSFTVAGSTEKYTANVYALEPEVETATRTLKLRARAENPDGKLLPGLFANISLPLNTIENALLIPTEAVVPIQNGKKVFITEYGKAKEVKVETSTRTENDVLVTEGLKAGDTVLTTGVMSLKEGASVKVTVGGEHKK